MSTEYRSFAKKFGQKVVELRKKNNITQEELANSAGIERSYMGAIERGERNPTLKKIFLISKALKISPRDFF